MNSIIRIDDDDDDDEDDNDGNIDTYSYDFRICELQI